MGKFSILFLLLNFLSVPLFGQAGGRALYLTDEDGLPQNKVKFIERDSFHYLWIGTQNGIARFDGYVFQQYPELVGVDIGDLFIDLENNVWAGTHQGLYLLNRVKNRFELKFRGDVQDISAFEKSICFITSDHLWLVKEDQKAEQLKVFLETRPKQVMIQKEFLWLGFGQQDGLKRFLLKEHSLSSERSYFKGKVINFLRNIQGKAWVGLSGGSLYVETSKGEFSKIVLQNRYTIKEVTVYQDNYWIATDGNGILVLDKEFTLVEHHKHSPVEKSISSNSIYDLFASHNGDLWIGTYDAGITYLSSEQLQFTPLSIETKNGNAAGYNGTSCFEDSDNNLWLGTQYGFYYMNKATHRTTSWDVGQCQKAMGGTKVLAFAQDKNKDIWVGTYDGGIARFRNKKLQETYFPFTNGLAQEQNINFMGTAGERIILNSMYTGLGALNIHDGTFTKFPLRHKGKRIDNYMTFAVRSVNGRILAHVYGKGLYQADLKKDELTLLLKTQYAINDFMVDAEGYYWLATRGFGLIKTDPAGNQLQKYTMEDGLSSNFLLRLEPDRKGNIWISSISGLMELDISSGRLTSYNHRHGLPSREFTPYGSVSLSDGRILFGTVRGFAFINPARKRPSNPPPSVVISDITFQNKSISALEKPLLTKPLELTTTLRLPYERNSFTIHFHSDDYNLPKYNRYAYRLKGLEQEWINLNENHQTNYTNLSPGHYVFEVKSWDKFNVESRQPQQLAITISPPWYLSHWAFLCYAVLISLLGIITYKIISYRIHMQKEVEFFTYKIENIKELNEKKLQFFTNVTHDFKTPLTLVSAPLEDLIHDESLDKNVVEKLNLIKRNADRLYNLIVELLDFRKLKGDTKQKLAVQKTNITAILSEMQHAFKDSCDYKRLTLHCHNECKEPVFIDPSKVRRILWNLVSNATKFTPPHGNIAIHCKQKTDKEKKRPPFLEITVTDNGKGLNEDEITHIFEEYYKTSAGNQDGSGLGLAIVKSLVEIHRGSIEASSKPGNRTSFVIHLPFRQDQYQPTEMVDQPNKQVRIPAGQPDKLMDIPERTRYNQPTLLIAEDNMDLNQYLKSILHKDYKVYTTCNGKDALQIAQTKSIDLIISDVMMPQMDGYSFCKAIKGNTDTSHIPVILLTANAATKHQVTGMASGADLYITKPFKAVFLKASVKGILENRQKLRKKFQGFDTIDKNNEPLNTRDLEFMDRFKTFIHANIQNPEIRIEDVSRELNCSKSSLIRKIKALAGTTPNNFIKIYKLNLAYNMMRHEGLKVNEAAYQTGFTDPNYFTTCFKKQFGINPSQISASTITSGV